MPRTSVLRLDSIRIVMERNETTEDDLLDSADFGTAGSDSGVSRAGLLLPGGSEVDLRADCAAGVRMAVFIQIDVRIDRPESCRFTRVPLGGDSVRVDIGVLV